MTNGMEYTFKPEPRALNFSNGVPTWGVSSFTSLCSTWGVLGVSVSESIPQGIEVGAVFIGWICFISDGAMPENLPQGVTFAGRYLSTLEFCGVSISVKALRNCFNLTLNGGEESSKVNSLATLFSLSEHSLSASKKD